MFMIAILRSMYHPDIQGKRSVRFVTETPDNPTDVKYFDTIDEAKNEIDTMENELYLLSNGEAGRPEYIIVDDNDGDYILSGQSGDRSNYDWTNAKCCCGECSKCLDMMIDQDRKYIEERGM